MPDVCEVGLDSSSPSWHKRASRVLRDCMMAMRCVGLIDELLWERETERRQKREVEGGKERGGGERESERERERERVRERETERERKRARARAREREDICSGRWRTNIHGNPGRESAPNWPFRHFLSCSPSSPFASAVTLRLLELHPRNPCCSSQRLRVSSLPSQVIPCQMPACGVMAACRVRQKP